MSEREVVCVTKDSSSNYDDCRCIDSIGYEVGSSVFTKTRERMHEKVKNGSHDYYAQANGSKAYLEARERNGEKYVRTESTDTTADNLLQQPSCQ